VNERGLRAGGSDGLPAHGTEAQGYLPELRGYPLTLMGRNLHSFISTGALVSIRYLILRIPILWPIMAE
jgi:hypothetical protein